MEKNLEDKIIAIIRSYHHFKSLPKDRMTGEEVYMLELLEQMVSILQDVGDNHDELVKRFYVHCDKYSIQERTSSESTDNGIALGVAMAMTGMFCESHTTGQVEGSSMMEDLYVDDSEMADLMDMA